MDHVPGTVYLLHLDRPYKHARHYLGWASDLQSRLASHAGGTGAKLLRVARDAGIGWTLARTWPGDRHRERQLKRQGGRSRMCPVCKQAGPAASAATPATQPAVAISTGPAAGRHLPADLARPPLARATTRNALPGPRLPGRDQLPGFEAQP